MRHWRLALTYALPAMPYAMLATPALSIVPPIYAKHGGLGLNAVALVLLIARTFDAIIDPFIGMLSDRTRHRIGQRGWIQAAIVLTMVSGYVWLQVGTGTSFAYFLGWSVCLCLGWSLFDIPHRALLAELAPTPGMRASLAAWRTGMSRLGTLACLLILNNAGESSLVTPATLQVLAAVVVPLLLVTGIAFHFGTSLEARHPDRGPPADQGNAHRARHDGGDGGDVRSPVPFLVSLARSTAARRVLTVSLLQGCATGMTSALYFLYMDDLLGIADRIPFIALVAVVAGLIGTWLWLPAIASIGNARTLAIGNLGLAIAVAAFCLVVPGDYSGWAVMAIFVASSLVAVGMETAMISLVAGIVRQHATATGQDRPASFFSLERFVSQIGTAVGAAMAILWVGATGFEIAGDNGAFAIAMFMSAFSLVPALLHVAAGLRVRSLSGSDLR